jgi:hypothetical protein
MGVFPGKQPLDSTEPFVEDGGIEQRLTTSLAQLASVLSTFLLDANKRDDMAGMYPTSRAPTSVCPIPYALRDLLTQLPSFPVTEEMCRPMLTLIRPG